MVQVAWAAAQTKNTYARALYQRVSGHRGKGRAIMAVAHSMLQAIWYMLSGREAYRELGANY